MKKEGPVEGRHDAGPKPGLRAEKTRGRAKQRHTTRGSGRGLEPQHQRRMKPKYLIDEGGEIRIEGRLVEGAFAQDLAAKDLEGPPLVHLVVELRMEVVGRQAPLLEEQRAHAQSQQEDSQPGPVLGVAEDVLLLVLKELEDFLDEDILLEGLDEDFLRAGLARALDGV